MLNLDKKECHINSNKENKGKMELSTEQQLSLYQISKDFKKSVWEETLQNVSFKREKKKDNFDRPKSCVWICDRASCCSMRDPMRCKSRSQALKQH